MFNKNTVFKLLAALMVLGACAPKQASLTPSAQDFSPYVKAYTGGIVADDAVIRVDLTQIPASAKLNDNLFSINPSIKGSMMRSGESFSFVPDPGALKSGTTYKVSFDLGKVFGAEVPSSFDFGLTVKGRSEDNEEEEASGTGFFVKRAKLADGAIEVTLSQEPANAQLKGMVQLQGAARSYVETEGKVLKVHFEGRNADLVLTLDSGLKSTEGLSLGEVYTRSFALSEDKPAVEIPLQGAILPDKKHLYLPFRAVNLGAVEVRVVKIYEKNVLMFLQDNELSGESSLRRSGRLVYRGDIPLDASKDLHKWNTHSVDLGGLFKQEPGAIYRIRISFRQDQSLWGGKEYMRRPGNPSGTPSAEDDAVWDIPSSYYWDNDYDWEKYNWDEADDPSKPSYYMDSDRFPSIQLIASDLGLMAEYAGGDKIWAAATDLLSAKPVSGAAVEVYDFQLQQIGSGKTDGKGLAEIKLSHKPFALVAKAGGSVAYLKVTSGNERSLSRFDVGGEVLKQGIKAFMYGERGVWRPGDTLHVTAIVSDKGHNLPAGHPATLEIYTPEGQFHSKLVRSAKDGFYSFSIPTQADDPTGFWNAYLKIGGSSFHKTLHVETVKPNRLKINTSIGNEGSVLQAGSKVTVQTQASWLAGGAAADCPAHAEMTLRKFSGSPFKGFEKYSFNDPSSKFTSAEFSLYKTRLNGIGEGSVSVAMPAAEGAPGILNAFIVTSVEEPGGDESFTTETRLYSPFSAYVGIAVPEGEYLETDKDQTIRLAVVQADGKRVRGHKVEYAVYRIGWNWWWDNPGGELDAYVSGNSVEKIAGGTANSGDKDISFIVREDYPKWGRYLILARDLSSGHTAGRFVSFDWPEYRGRAGRQDPEALTMISFSTDKKSYLSGEKATVYVPAAKGGQALVSLENASGVISREWVQTSDKDTPYTFTVTPEMAPNFYIHITLLQPYGQADNDLPLRLYGVQRVKVENPASHLEPQIKLPKVLHPEEPFTVTISEKNGKPMTYTLAIVDEGLLDVTAFKTPDPWSAMYKDEALGVSTWDLYDQVIGAWGGKLSPLAAIGGDEDAVMNSRKDNRFNPVVMFLPPKTLSKGSDELKLKLPMYVGSVRLMVVAGHEGAFGSADATVPVQNPLMLVTTLPRVLGTGEEVSVPVNVFAMEDGVRSANVSIKADGPVEIVGPASQNVSFSGTGDKLVRFDIRSTSDEGIAHISVNASGASYKASETIALEVRNAQAEITQVQRFTIGKGEKLSLKGSSGSSLQLTSFPALDARAMYINMRDYPYDCGEQLSARGLTLLKLLPLLEEADAAQAKALIPDIIGKLYSRQMSDGGFAYWSGGRSDSWVSSMAGLFLSEASKAGFEVNAGVLKSWKEYQQKISQVYRIAGNNFFSHADEAFRLYTLAAAGASSSSGMNRLKEAGEIGEQAKWLLSGAYALSGKGTQAAALLDGTAKTFEEYEPDVLTFGSSLRDRFAAIDALALNGRIADALSLAEESTPERYLSTQETAFAALAYGHLLSKVATSVKATVNGAEVSASGSWKGSLEKDSAVQNTGDGPLYASIVRVSRSGVRSALSNGLQLDVKYTDENGSSVNPASLPQGTRFKATIRIVNPSALRSYSNLALCLRTPSGWEIQNERLTGGAGAEGYDHKDIRDDRVSWFFGLPASRSKTFTVQLRAAYEGVYMMPSVVCEAMYDPTVNACTASGRAAVTR